MGSVTVTERPHAVQQVQLPTDNLKRVPVDIIKGEQPWCTIHLADGNRLRVQLVVHQVLAVEGGLDEYGNQAYDIVSGPLFRTFPPKKNSK
jgi:hypothetical protein